MDRLIEKRLYLHLLAAEVGVEAAPAHDPPCEAAPLGQDCSFPPFWRAESRRGFDYSFHHSQLLLEWELSDLRPHFCTGPF